MAHSNHLPFKKVHLIGICGAGMQPIAMALRSCGIAVAGSDPDEVKGQKLREQGITYFSEHRAENVRDADAIVYSSAISDENPEIRAARERGIPIFHRSEMLGKFLSQRESVLIAGTHGKTTTTTLTGLLLQEAGLDPWVFVGGRVDEFGGNLREGGELFAVAEADESDGSFLNLSRNHLIITNIEAEHMNYWVTEERLFDGFSKLCAPIGKKGRIVACLDDPGVRKLRAIDYRDFCTYSTRNPAADYFAEHIALRGTGSQFELFHRGAKLGTVQLGIPGIHNVANATAAFAMAAELGIDVRNVLGALSEFRGVDRRFRKSKGPNGSLVIDDYAHHPTEIAATLAAARLLAHERGGRLYGVFQPHRHSRTAHFFDQFAQAFGDLDELMLLDIYGAGEPPVPGISSEILAKKIGSGNRPSASFVPEFDDVKKRFQNVLKVDDIVVLLGAGSVTKLSGLLTPAHE